MRGVVYVAYGEPAKAAAGRAIKALKQHHPEWPVTVIGEQVQHGQALPFASTDQLGRWAKVNIDLLSPYDPTLYLDADTIIQESVQPLFEIVEDGWDMAIVASKYQTTNWLHHVGNEERRVTTREMGGMMLQLGGGVFSFAKNRRTARFFNCWREEWKRWQGQDQAALIRALQRAPLKVWILSKMWNGGDIIKHLWGTARRKR